MTLTPPKLTPTDVARIYRPIFGGNRHDKSIQIFAAAIESALNAKWLEMLAGQEAVAQMTAHTIKQIEDGYETKP